MSGIYEEIKRHLGANVDANTGFSTLDMMFFPAPVRRILRMMMRKVEMSYDELRKQIDELPEEKRPLPEEIDESLDALVKIGWLAMTMTGNARVYRLEMGIKAGSAVTKASPEASTKSTISHLWDTFDEAAENEEKKSPELRRARSGRSTPSVLDVIESRDKASRGEVPPEETARPLPEVSSGDELKALWGEDDKADRPPVEKPRRKRQPDLWGAMAEGEQKAGEGPEQPKPGESRPETPPPAEKTSSDRDEDTKGLGGLFRRLRS